MSVTVKKTWGWLVAVLEALIDDVAGVQPTACSESALAMSNGVFDGLRAGAPTTGSSQLTGAGNTDWNVNVSAGACVVNDVEKEFAAQADYDVHSGSQLLTEGQAVYGWLVASEAAGTVAMEVVMGTPATSGSETVPTDADITTGVTHSNWIKLGLLHLHRDGDTSVVQTESNLYRDLLSGPTAQTLVNEIRTNINASASYTATALKYSS